MAKETTKKSVKGKARATFQNKALRSAIQTAYRRRFRSDQSLLNDHVADYEPMAYMLERLKKVNTAAFEAVLKKSFVPNEAASDTYVEPKLVYDIAFNHKDAVGTALGEAKLTISLDSTCAFQVAGKRGIKNASSARAVNAFGSWISKLDKENPGVFIQKALERQGFRNARTRAGTKTQSQAPLPSKPA